MKSVKNTKKRVLVAMSGGVDSSVAALLLKRKGFNVVGAHMKCWESDFQGCSGPEDEIAARLAAGHLNIPFYVFDFTKEYKEKVFKYFLKEQKAGRTPNPDVMCNRHIKFGIFLEKALESGFDYVATGHYARVYRAEGKASRTKRYRLLKGWDKNKDQSYFLSLIQPDVLGKILFPLGNYTKVQVRRIAKRANLPSAKRPDSQGLCFVGNVKINDFLKEYLDSKPGLIIDTSGKKIGRHDGIWFYTVGQRKGIGLSGGPYFVLQKDLQKNLLIVTKKENDLFKKELEVENVNWLSGKKPLLPLRVEVKIRYRVAPVLATMTKSAKKGSYRLAFKKQQRAVTPGQTAVFYKNQELLGGGIIV